MFAIGQTTATVVNSKLILPAAYRLKRKSVLAKWKDENTLYLSDSDKSLNFTAGRDGELLKINVDSEDKINLPKDYDNSKVKIQGCISTIEITFRR